MPVEITSRERFLELSETASECRVKRSKELVKLKLRTPAKLYTMKLDVSEAEETISKLKCQVVEV